MNSVETYPSREIVEAARRGDQAAFVELVQRRGDRLYGVAYRITRDPECAKDALQDALVLAWRDLANLRDPDRFDAWFHRLLTNACYRLMSRERRRAAGLMSSAEPRSEDEMDVVDDRDQLVRCFRRIKAEERALLVLRHYSGYEPSEIAAAMGIPAGTVRSRLHQAYRAMRAALDAEARREQLA